MVVMSSSITMSSSLLGAAVVVVVLLGSGLTATGARARTMGSAKADNTMPGKYRLYYEICLQLERLDYLNAMLNVQ